METIAIVAATFLGPIFAVLVAKYNEERSSLKQRRLHIFRILIATRRIPVNPDHVNALNLIEIDFYGYKEILDQWKIYMDHLNQNESQEGWNDKREKELSKLLCKIGKVLKYPLDSLETYNSGYAPGKWNYQEQKQEFIFEYIYKLSQGTNTLPISVRYMDPQLREPVPANTTTTPVKSASAND